MSNWLEFFIALALGFSGSTHCALMCGGISCASGKVARGEASERLWLLSSFSVGRVMSYALAGLCFGSLTYAAFSWHYQLLSVFRLLAAGLLFAMALQLAQYGAVLQRFEALGQRLWQALVKALRLSLPLRRWQDGLLLGLFWGWLPCGLIYSTLAWASLSANPLEAGLKMFAFGLGTLPMMVGMGFAGASVLQHLRAPKWRLWAAALMAAFALWTAYGALLHWGDAAHGGAESLMCVA